MKFITFNEEFLNRILQTIFFMEELLVTLHILGNHHCHSKWIWQYCIQQPHKNYKNMHFWIIDMHITFMFFCNEALYREKLTIFNTHVLNMKTGSNVWFLRQSGDFRGSKTIPPVIWEWRTRWTGAFIWIQTLITI